ncbi:hypothetical protein GB937_009433 [Aspergillus fischeri]|nr:hypothetical protein GB937_009433 [Aspergillus fischeri]
MYFSLTFPRAEQAKPTGVGDGRYFVIRFPVEPRNGTATGTDARRSAGINQGRGVDVVVENSLSSLARRGTVSLVGFLGGFNVDRFLDMMGPVLLKSATIRGIAVGSKINQQNLCNFLSEKQVVLKPILDEAIFSFKDSQAAFDHLYAARHTGKVVIKM